MGFQFEVAGQPQFPGILFAYVDRMKHFLFIVILASFTFFISSGIEAEQNSHGGGPAEHPQNPGELLTNAQTSLSSLIAQAKVRANLASQQGKLFKDSSEKLNDASSSQQRSEQIRQNLMKISANIGKVLVSAVGALGGGGIYIDDLTDDVMRAPPVDEAIDKVENNIRAYNVDKTLFTLMQSGKTLRVGLNQRNQFIVDDLDPWLPSSPTRVISTAEFGKMLQAFSLQLEDRNRGLQQAVEKVASEAEPAFYDFGYFQTKANQRATRVRAVGASITAEIYSSESDLYKNIANKLNGLSPEN